MMVNYTFCETITHMSKRRQRNDGYPEGSVRTTMSFSPDRYQTLEGIARQEKASRVWVVFESAEQYVADKWPPCGENQFGERSQ